jgi:hypothetical protein
MCEGYYARTKGQAAHQMPEEILQKIHKQYWDHEHQQHKYNTLVRKFWENPDTNDSYQQGVHKKSDRTNANKRSSLRTCAARLNQMHTKRDKCKQVE